MKSYLQFVNAFAGLMRNARNIPAGTAVIPPMPAVLEERPILMFSPHPDDEVLTGMPLGIRFRRERIPVVNVAMGLGRPEQYARRRKELDDACAYLGIESLIPGTVGLHESLSMPTEITYTLAVVRAVNILQKYKPQAIIAPHDDDAHPGHIETSSVVKAALARCLDLDCVFFEGEYWHEMNGPNLQVEVASETLALLLEALSFHKGEISRNPYTVVWPSLMHQNSRRHELITGWGTAGEQFTFSVMYRASKYVNGAYEVLPKMQIPTSFSVRDLLKI